MDKAFGRYKTGTVERRGSTWFLRYRDGDERRRVRIGSVKDFPTKGAAERACSGIRERINSPERFTARRTMADTIARYMAEEMPQRADTAKGYRAWLKGHIEPKWGSYALEDIKAHDVRTWLRALPLSDKSRGHVHAQMRAMFRFAMLWEWMPATINPMQLFRMEHSTRRAKEPRVLTPVEFQMLIAELVEPARSMVTICGALGLRCSELTGLKWEDFNWHERILTVRRSAVAGRIDEVKTRKSGKPMPVAEELLPVFHQIRAGAIGAEPGDWIFPGCHADKSGPRSAYPMQRDHIKPAGRRAGLGQAIGWHALRHSYRAWLDRLGAPIGVQRDLMRHTDIRTTMNVYGGTFTDEMKEAQGSVARMILQ